MHISPDTSLARARARPAAGRQYSFMAELGSAAIIARTGRISRERASSQSRTAAAFTSRPADGHWLRRHATALYRAPMPSRTAAPMSALMLAAASGAIMRHCQEADCRDYGHDMLAHNISPRATRTKCRHHLITSAGRARRARCTRRRHRRECTTH